MINIWVPELYLKFMESVFRNRTFKAILYFKNEKIISKKKLVFENLCSIQVSSRDIKK